MAIIPAFVSDITRAFSMNNSFKTGFKKVASGGKFYHAAELAGLGALALPSALHLATGRDMKAKPYHMLETAGLGILAAPSIVSLMKGLKKLK